MAELTFDTAEFDKGTERLEMTLSNVRKESLDMVADFILKQSQDQVPHDKGTLQDSGTKEPDGEDILVGYNTEYAAHLHEHPEYNFQAGRKGKYLEDPIKNNLNALNDILGKRLQEGLI